MKTWGRHCLTWSGHQLFRLLPGGLLSDMVNLSRAKDAAAALVLAGLNEAEESVTGRPRMRVRRSPLPRQPSAERPLCGRVGERL
jgi:hypothetical protein